MSTKFMRLPLAEARIADEPRLGIEILLLKSMHPQVTTMDHNEIT
jgi:hypothetical protein